MNEPRHHEKKISNLDEKALALTTLDKEKSI